ncbi:MAG TPA: hypothetical protein DE147_00630 [Gammaproteobacteria bacterium]|nr:hypothetical protein [Gammaproteobacteria bacterium]HCG68926.1 hypothetical protein [Gammaproteobacteria bacterium]
MDWQRYKRLCDQADYWSAWMLSQCITLLQASELTNASSVIAKLQADLAGSPLPFPPGHRGDLRTQMFHVSLTFSQCQTLLEVIELANANQQYTPDTRSRGLAGFAESCEELLRWRATDVDG